MKKHHRPAGAALKIVKSHAVRRDERARRASCEMIWVGARAADLAKHLAS